MAARRQKEGYLGVTAFAAAVGIPRTTAWHLARRGDLFGAEGGQGRHWSIPVRAVELYKMGFRFANKLPPAGMDLTEYMWWKYEGVRWPLAGVRHPRV